MTAHVKLAAGLRRGGFECLASFVNGTVTGNSTAAGTSRTNKVRSLSSRPIFCQVHQGFERPFDFLRSRIWEHYFYRFTPPSIWTRHFLFPQTIDLSKRNLLREVPEMGRD